MINVINLDPPPSHVVHHCTDKVYNKLVSAGSSHPEEALCEELTIVRTLYKLLPCASKKLPVSCIICPRMN